ncbi:hypothetical protein [Kitasatospora sp. NPDC047058]|uniref:hypothetical protein n=1 Tax=Kitasatospora sp. NPDC047058 TaxID=3155620 RepID=UPI0033C09C89
MTLEHRTSQVPPAPPAGRAAQPPASGDVAALRRRISELEHENAILREASDFFTRELDPRRPH